MESSASSTNTPPLGMLGRVTDLRPYWPDEARDFTPWLAKPENLQILAETIGLELEPYRTEEAVGSFRADIVALSDGDYIIIENQLGPTDHKHLGQVMVYATNRDARAVVWIATKFTDEHRKVLDWLNTNTAEEIGFFGLEIELWQIDDSPPAAKFNVVCRPNELTKIETSAGAQSPTKLLQLQFWTAVREHAEGGSSPLSWRNPVPRFWYTMAVGRTGFGISLTAKTKTDTLGCEIYIDGQSSFDANDALELLLDDRAEIEAELGQLDWQPLPEKRACRIIQTIDADLQDEDAWEQSVAWCVKRAEAFSSCFAPRVRDLVLAPPNDGLEDESD